MYVKQHLNNWSFILDSWRRDDAPFRNGRDRDDRFHRERDRDRDRERERDRDRDRDRERDRDRDREWDRDRGKNSWDQDRGTYFKLIGVCVLDYICSFTCALLSPVSRVLLENLLASEPVKNFPAFCGTQEFISVFTGDLHFFLS